MLQAMSNRSLLLICATLACATSWLSGKDNLFPSISDSAEPEWFPGKIVWHDLFTTDADAAAAFYA